MLYISTIQLDILYKFEISDMFDISDKLTFQITTIIWHDTLFYVLFVY